MTPNISIQIKPKGDSDLVTKNIFKLIFTKLKDLIKLEHPHHPSEAVHRAPFRIYI